MSILQPAFDFVEQSKRVVNVTHKPKDEEFRQMTLITGLGLAVIGIIGFIISMVAHFLR